MKLSASTLGLGSWRCRLQRLVPRPMEPLPPLLELLSLSPLMPACAASFSLSVRIYGVQRLCVER